MLYFPSLSFSVTMVTNTNKGKRRVNLLNGDSDRKLGLGDTNLIVMKKCSNKGHSN